MDGSADAERASPTGERFEPTFMHGRIIEAEHLARYSWACRFAPGKRVLDAACGMAYGTAMLVDAEASEVVGIDIDESLIAEVRRVAPPNASFDVGDLRELPYEDDDFDLIVCFEAIEHVPDPEKVLDELSRVLRDDGLLALSTPNRDVYAPGNPFHLRELTPNELDAELRKRFRAVTLRRQHTWVASGIFDDETFKAGANERIDEAEVRKAYANEPGLETYTLALAGNGAIPADQPLLDLSSDIDLREWGERLSVVDQFIESTRRDQVLREGAELGKMRGELASLRTQLAHREAEMERFTELSSRVAEAEEALADYRRSAEITSSSSWRLTRPLRAIGDWVRRFRR